MYQSIQGRHIEKSIKRGHLGKSIDGGNLDKSIRGDGHGNCMNRPSGANSVNNLGRPDLIQCKVPGRK